MIPKYPNDREYFIDKEGGIYQVIGYIHPKNAIHCLKKYSVLDISEENTSQFSWKSQITCKNYTRDIQSYSSLTAATNIQNNHFRKFSEIYGVDFIQFPMKEIETYLDPILCLKMLRKDVKTKFLQLSDQERISIEVSHIFEQELGISPTNLGVTGSILWKGVHAQSDIDMIIYGIPNVKKFHYGIDRLLATQEKIQRLSLTERINLAGKFSQKSGLSIDDCTVFISQKKFLLNFSKFFLSVAFNPTVEEISQNILATDNTTFRNISHCNSVTLRCTVKNDDWLYFYPGVMTIENVEILSPNLKNCPEICRVVIFEHENVGYYEKGDHVEIKGLIQRIENPPEQFITSGSSKYDEKESYGQIIVGTYENYGAEYIKNLNL